MTSTPRRSDRPGSVDGKKRGCAIKPCRPLPMLSAAPRSADTVGRKGTHGMIDRCCSSLDRGRRNTCAPAIVDVDDVAQTVEDQIFTTSLVRGLSRLPKENVRNEERV